MCKLFSHIGSIKKSLALITLIFFVHAAFAQNTSDTSSFVDSTVVQENEYHDEDETPVFDSLDMLNLPSFPRYEIDDSVVRNLKNDEAFWYADRLPKRQKASEVDPNKKYSEPFYLQNWFRTLLWIVIVAAFIGVLVWFLIASDIKLFRKKAKALHTTEDSLITEDIFSIDYEEEIEKAVRNNNYRLGVRLMYLHVLRLLSEKNIIQYKIERTNSDYLLQLFNTSYYKDFFRLTRNFEYVWYGKFDISPAAFDSIREDHSKIKSLL